VPPVPPSGIPVPGGHVVIEGVSGSPAAVYQALRARGHELANQREELQDQRGELTGRLQAENLDPTDRDGLRAQLADVDARIKAVNGRIDANQVAIEQAAGVPGAIQEEKPPERNGPPDEVFIIIPVVFTIFVLFPLAFAWARRLWKKPVAGPAPIPPELIERMTRLEQAVESVAVEVERIGEGQRFVTKLFAENPRPLELPK
jgi:hypothetical protein